jgi:hypothetical protein
MAVNDDKNELVDMEVEEKEVPHAHPSQHYHTTNVACCVAMKLSRRVVWTERKNVFHARTSQHYHWCSFRP